MSLLEEKNLFIAGDSSLHPGQSLCSKYKRLYPVRLLRISSCEGSYISKIVPLCMKSFFELPAVPDFPEIWVIGS